MTQDQAKLRLSEQWNKHDRKVDWLAFEQFQRDVMESTEILAAETKLLLLAEAIGAWTGRGIPRLY